MLLAEDSSSDRGILVEIILGGVGALIVLALVFASLLAGLPLLVAAVSILATFLALLGLTTLTKVSFVVQYLVALIGLGVAIDYSLLIVMRWREERARGADNDTAVRSAIATAGRSVVFSGTTDRATPADSHCLVGFLMAALSKCSILAVSQGRRLSGVRCPARGRLPAPARRGGQVQRSY